MPYNSENFKRIGAEFQEKKHRAESEADARQLQAEAVIPELNPINRELESTGMEILGAALSGGNIDEKLAAIKARMSELRREKRRLLLEAGFPEDFTEVKYECPICNDTGYADGKMCRCFKEQLVLAGIESSGLGQLVRTQSFDSFSLDYYSGTDRDFVCRYRDTLREFANDFTGTGDASWVLAGATGLGKTHLSSAVAMEVIKRGFDVVYVPISGMISVFERQRFGGGSPGDGSDRQFFDCDLLIIDDLGTETVNQFSISCLYNVLNSRLIAGRSTIINTNLMPDEIKKLYTDRICSRLLGEFNFLLFKGHDVRMQKVRMQ